jgi:hypothetical protein
MRIGVANPDDDGVPEERKITIVLTQEEARLYLRGDDLDTVTDKIVSSLATLTR